MKTSGKLRLPTFRIRLTATRDRGSREGASIVVIVMMLLSFLVLAGVSIDYAYMTLIKKELAIATDVAAKAGAIVLSDSHDVGKAKSAAVLAARRITVGGKSFKIRTDDVQVGRIDLQDDKSWRFTNRAFPFNSVRVNSKVGGDAEHEPIPLFFGGITGLMHFEPETHAVAGQPNLAISICLDRSGSMIFDLSGKEYTYPPNNPFYQVIVDDVFQNNLMQIPHPLHSRWAVLSRSIDSFFDSMAEMIPQPRVGLVTWAGAHHEKRLDPAVLFTDSTLDHAIRKQGTSTFLSDRAMIQSIIGDYGSRVMMGYTNTSAGLNQSRKDLNRPEISDFHRKVIVLFTDGLWNMGSNPVEVAKLAAKESITIYVVSMLADKVSSKEDDMREVARITGGEYFTAKNEAELKSAFKSIASLVSTVITE